MRCVRIFSRTGFTLLETVLALALSAMLMTSLSLVLKSVIDGWESGPDRMELVQHARMAMDRMVAETRYATLLTDLQTGSVDFDTVNLINSTTNTTEQIRYERQVTELHRSVDGGLSAVLAGSTLGLVLVDNFVVHGYKYSGGTLIEMNGADTPGMAVAVLYELTVKDVKGRMVTISSMAKIRNKQVYQ